MSSVTKKQKIIQEKLDPEKTYSITEAMEIIQSVKSEKFDESIDISVPPYLPKNNIVINDMKRMYSNIVELDNKIGLILKQLEEDNLLEKTVIVFYTDHGGPLPREKRLLYDSGIKVPMIIRFPNKTRAGELDNRMISFVDFAPTLLSLASINIPNFHLGKSFEGYFKSKKESFSNIICFKRS